MPSEQSRNTDRRWQESNLRQSKKVTSMRREVVNAGLRVLNLNAHSIRNKVNELVAHIEIGQYDVVGITKTWLQGDQGWDLNIQGYVSYRKDRQMGKGGGVALLVRDEVKSIARNDIGSGGIESLWVELRNCKGKKNSDGSNVQAP